MNQIAPDLEQIIKIWRGIGDTQSLERDFTFDCVAFEWDESLFLKSVAVCVEISLSAFSSVYIVRVISDSSITLIHVSNSWFKGFVYFLSDTNIHGFR